MCFHVTSRDSIRHALITDGFHQPIEQDGIVMLSDRPQDTGLSKTCSRLVDEINWTQQPRIRF